MCVSLLYMCVSVVQLRKNPPSPLNRGKRISGTKEKFRKSGTATYKSLCGCGRIHSFDALTCVVLVVIVIVVYIVIHACNTAQHIL